MRNKGITLIALVITIIVLLILAGVSIAMLTGENGILTQAQNAKERTEEAGDKEKIQLAVNSARIGNDNNQGLGQNNLQEEMDKEFGEGKTVVRDNGDGSFTVSLVDSKKDYTITSSGEITEGVNWNEVMKNAVAPESQEQTPKNVIGIGANGEVVNMDLWLYSFDTVTNGYGLNSKEVFQNTEYNTNGTNTETIRTAGYKGTEKNGKDIIIPQYISEDGGKTYSSVTSLYRTFNSNTNIETMPIIPTTVINMFSSFEGCTNLKECIIPSSVENIHWCYSRSGIEKIKEIPNSVIYMNGSFDSCNVLEYINLKIPDNVKALNSSFSNCEKLEKVNLILPEGLESMYGTFLECKKLEEANLVLPEGLENMKQTFYYCTNLTKGPNVIPESVTDMTQTFQGDAKLTGEMTIKALPTEYNNVFRLTSTDENARLVIKQWNNNMEFLNQMIESNTGPDGEHVVGEWKL